MSMRSSLIENLRKKKMKSSRTALSKSEDQEQSDFMTNYILNPDNLQNAPSPAKNRSKQRLSVATVGGLGGYTKIERPPTSPSFSFHNNQHQSKNHLLEGESREDLDQRIENLEALLADKEDTIQLLKKELFKKKAAGEEKKAKKECFNCQKMEIIQSQNRELDKGLQEFKAENMGLREEVEAFRRKYEYLVEINKNLTDKIKGDRDPVMATEEVGIVNS